MFAHKKAHCAMVISALLSLGSAGHIFAMQGQPGHLAFVLDGERCVQSCQALGGMKFYKDKAAEDFWGKDIMTVIPLSDSAVEKLDIAFAIAPIEKDAIRVDYTLEETGNFQASIMPVRGLNGAGFIVLVRSMLAAQSAEVESPAVRNLREEISTSNDAVNSDEWDELDESSEDAINSPKPWKVSRQKEEIWAPQPWNERQQEG